MKQNLKPLGTKKGVNMHIVQIKVFKSEMNELYLQVNLIKPWITLKSSVH